LTLLAEALRSRGEKSKFVGRVEVTARVPNPATPSVSLPYLSLAYKRQTFTPSVLNAVWQAKENYGQTQDFAGKTGTPTH